MAKRKKKKVGEDKKKKKKNARCYDLITYGPYMDKTDSRPSDMANYVEGYIQEWMDSLV